MQKASPPDPGEIWSAGLVLMLEGQDGPGGVTCAAATAEQVSCATCKACAALLKCISRRHRNVQVGGRVMPALCTSNCATNLNAGSIAESRKIDLPLQAALSCCQESSVHTSALRSASRSDSTAATASSHVASRKPPGVPHM